MWLDLLLLTFNRQKGTSVRILSPGTNRGKVDQQNRTSKVVLSDTGTVLGVSCRCSLPNLSLSFPVIARQETLNCWQAFCLEYVVQYGAE